jgi:phage gp46-like protein
MTSEKRGLLAPLRRDRQRDFASGAGAELLGAKVRQVLGTDKASPRSSGELPWRTAFGAPLQLLRHQNNDAVLAELARTYVRDALARWLPSAQVVAVDVDSSGPSLRLRVRVVTRDGLTIVVPVDVAQGVGEGHE